MNAKNETTIERIARLEEQQKNMSNILIDIRNSLKEIPTTLKIGFREIREELNHAHKEDISIIQEEIYEERKERKTFEEKMELFLIIADHPRASIIIATIVVVFLVTNPDNALFRLVVSWFAGSH